MGNDTMDLEQLARYLRRDARELARLVDRALPGQILIGDFTADVVSEQGGRSSIGTVDFVERMGRAVWDLEVISLAGEAIREIKCYLTGPAKADGIYEVARYHAVDKHGFRHPVYNA